MDGFDPMIPVCYSQTDDCLSVGLASPTAASALTTIINAEPEALAFLFGYTHRDALNQRSAAQIFTKEVLPELEKRGINDLVMEIFPFGQPGSKIDKELAEFNRTGKIGPEMDRFLPYLDKKYFRALLLKAFKLGIKIHAGGVNYETASQTVLKTSFVMDEETLQRTIREINENSLAMLGNLIKQGKRAASFGGASHNNLTPTEDQQKMSFARQLADGFQGKVVEIDLVIPELSREYDYAKKLPLSPACKWESFIPVKGRELVIPIPFYHAYILYWPEKK